MDLTLDEQKIIQKQVSEDGIEKTWGLIRKRIATAESKGSMLKVLKLMDFAIQCHASDKEGSTSETQDSSLLEAILKELNGMRSDAKESMTSLIETLQRAPSSQALQEFSHSHVEPQHYQEEDSSPAPSQPSQAHLQAPARVYSYSGTIRLTNPQTGEMQEFSSSTTWWAWIFGPFQLIKHGAWVPALLTMFCPFICPFINKKLIVNHYLKQGYQPIRPQFGM